MTDLNYRKKTPKKRFDPFIFKMEIYSLDDLVTKLVLAQFKR